MSTYDTASYRKGNMDYQTSTKHALMGPLGCYFQKDYNYNGMMLYRQYMSQTDK